MAGAPTKGKQKIGLKWSNPAVQSVVYQAALIAVVLYGGWVIVTTTQANLARLNIATGFGFMDNTAGFGIVQSLIPYTEESSYGRAFLVGLINTLMVAGIGIVLATILGFFVGVARLSSNWLVSRLAWTYVEVMRNIPLLLQLFFCYFTVLRPLPPPADSLSPLEGVYLNNRGVVVPSPVFGESSTLFVIAVLLSLVAGYAIIRWARKRQAATGEIFPAWRTAIAIVLGVPALIWLVGGAPFTLDLPVYRGFGFDGGMRLIPEFIALLLGLTLYTAAFIAEIVRAGILSVSHGQTEAAYALGLPQGRTLRLVVIPQALRVIVPPLTSQLLNLTKNSSLAVAIAYPDLVAVFAGTVLNQTGQAIEVIALTMAVYLTISLVTSFLMNLYNARVAIQER
ncbi:amino acid ABC transporter permease [Parvibaculum sp.]|uniref:amino acid ABC transporter permease n=1 Tax=Parvibaculum sp. TaxID=2024848 RepID=UPI0025EC2644|nr:amino acid ABC transporter permease [Parvibaculum sp.]